MPEHMSKKKLSHDREVYHSGSDIQFEFEEIAMGAPTSYSLVHDPKHIGFVLARYKFVAKMLGGKKRVMEIGSGDGVGVPIVAKEVGQLHCIDWDERHQESIARRLKPHFKNIHLHHHDMNKKPVDVSVDAMYMIDVIEHVDPRKERLFMKNLLHSLDQHGVMITGTPNITASQYASDVSNAQHINLKSVESLQKLMQKYFHNVFMFGMNDEVLHTGYGPMSHYIWSVAVGKK